MALDFLTQAIRDSKNPYHFGEGSYYSAWDRFWRDLTGETARSGLASLARRIYALEKGERVSMDTLTSLAAKATGERTKPFEAMSAALQEAHQKTLARADNLAAQVEDMRSAQHSHNTELEALRDRISEHVESLEQSIAALPEGLRADLRIELDQLRNTPDAVTALLYGAETFAGAVARSLEDTQ